MNQSANRPDELIAILRGDFPLGLVPIAQTTLAAPVASVTFAGVPQNFRTLMLISLPRTDRVAVGDFILLQFNGDAGVNYNRETLRGQNVAASALNAMAITGIQIGYIEGANALANAFSSVIAFIPNYRSGARKTVISLATVFGSGIAADAVIEANGGQWSGIAAITSITLSPAFGPNFVAGSVFQLYGIL